MQKSLRTRAADNFRSALNDLVGLVPKDQRDVAITLQLQLEHYGALMTEGIEAMDQIASARHYFLYAAERHINDADRINLGE